MKKMILLVCLGFAFTVSVPAFAAGEKMKGCSKEATGMEGDERRAFMKKCLSNDYTLKADAAPAAPATTAAAPAALAADSGEAVFKQNNCNVCHATNRKSVGPSLKDIATRYAGDKGAQAKLEMKTRSGGSGSFGSMPMPGTTRAVSDGDIKTMVAWTLSPKALNDTGSDPKGHKSNYTSGAVVESAVDSTGASSSNISISNPNSSAKNSNWQSARTCDGQCVLLVAETKCKHIKINEDNLSCLIQNGLGTKNDTPEICAQAKSLMGCMTKAEKLAAKNSSETTAPKKYRYGSVCERNYEKIQNVIRKNNIMQAGATYDLFMKDIQWHFAKIFEPCTGSSTEAARAYKASMDEYNKISQYCAGAHPKYTCTQWGASGGISDNGGNPYNNPAYYAVFKAEVDKALADPDYSADLGTVTGSGAVNAADAACAASLKTIENQYSAAQRDIPANSVVVLSEANMWRIAKSIEVIKAQCPQSERYKAEVASIQSSYGEIKRVCDATASNPPCKPRLPGKEPAPAPQVATALPPLQSKPPASCESQSGANWKKCLQEACAKVDGKFSGSNCVSCYWAGGGWNRCPPGSGGVNSNQ